METRFEFRDFARVFGSGIFLYGFFVGLFFLFPQISEIVDSWHPAASFAVNYMLQLIILFWPLYHFVIKKYQANALDFGIQKVEIGRLLFSIFVTYVFYTVLTIIISSFLYTKEIDLPGYHAQASHLSLFGNDPAGIITASIFIIIIAPIFEEIFFRGFVYRILKKTWSIWFGSIVTATLFALFHFEFQSFIPLFILGLLLNYNYQRTGSLWTSIAFHALNNGIAFGLEIYLNFHPDALKDLVTPLGLF